MKWGLGLGVAVSAVAAASGEKLSASALSQGTKVLAEGMARASERRRVLQGGEIDISSELVIQIAGPCLDEFGLTDFVICLLAVDPDAIETGTDNTDAVTEALTPLLGEPTTATIDQCVVVFTDQPTAQCLATLPSIDAVEVFSLAANESFVDQQPECEVFTDEGLGGDSLAGSASESDDTSDSDSTLPVFDSAGTQTNITGEELFTSFRELKDHCETLQRTLVVLLRTVTPHFPSCLVQGARLDAI